MSTSKSAFFYSKPVVLDRTVHQKLRFEASNARFATQSQAVPLLAVEFPMACLEYPIAFVKSEDGQWMSLALTGLTENVNAFVDAKGNWLGRYVPASVRRYPFILAEGANGQLSLAADLDAPHFGKKGERLFDDQGEPTETAKAVLTTLADFQAQAASTQAFVQRLDEAGLLTQQNLEVRLDAQRSARLESVWIIDEAQLRQLPDEKALAWFKSGELALIHAQMLSLRNLVNLLDRSQPVVVPAKTRVTKLGDGSKSKATERTSSANQPSKNDQ